MITLPITYGLQLDWLTPETSETKPVVTVNDGILMFPAFIKKEYVEEEDPETKEKKQKLQYKYYPVKMAYMGEDVTDYVKVMRMRWDEIRKHFYGPDSVQHEMNVKGQLIAHQLAVKAIFKKNEDDELPEDMIKFNIIYNRFWTTIACMAQKFGIPYGNIPDYFDSSYLMALAEQYKIPSDVLSTMITTIQLIVDDLFSNSRRWKELMPKPALNDFVKLM